MSTPSAETGEITRLLRAWQEGNDDAHQALWALLYPQLRALARSALRPARQANPRRVREGTTSLVHEAFLRLLGSDVDWNDRRHFFAVASRAMRFVLIDEARRQLTEKRRWEVADVLHDEEGPWEPADPKAFRPEEVLAVHQALAKLAELNPRHEKLVELRYFAGLTVDETAEVLGVTSRTVVRDWKSVRAWLQHRLETAPKLAAP